MKSVSLAWCRRSGQADASDVDTRDAQYRTALDVAVALLSDARGLVQRREDPTAGATHYHARALFPPPRWAIGHTPCTRIGSHLFYNDIS